MTLIRTPVRCLGGAGKGQRSGEKSPAVCEGPDGTNAALHTALAPTPVRPEPLARAAPHRAPTGRNTLQEPPTVLVNSRTQPLTFRQSQSADALSLSGPPPRIPLRVTRASSHGRAALPLPLPAMPTACNCQRAASHRDIALREAQTHPLVPVGPPFRDAQTHLVHNEHVTPLLFPSFLPSTIPRLPVPWLASPHLATRSLTGR